MSDNKAYTRKQTLERLKKGIEEKGYTLSGVDWGIDTDYGVDRSGVVSNVDYSGVDPNTISGAEVRKRYEDFVQSQIQAQINEYRALKNLEEQERASAGLHEEFIKQLEFQLENHQNSNPSILDKVKELAMHVDEGIAEFVCTLRFHGIETVQSCEGGKGGEGSEDHAYAMPTVDFIGSEGAGLQALGICVEYGFPVRYLSRVWNTDNSGQISEVFWRIEFYKKGRKVSNQSTDSDWIGA